MPRRCGKCTPTRLRDGVVATDDAALFERAGLPVAVVPGDARNRKITTPDDLAWAEAVLSTSGERQP